MVLPTYNRAGLLSRAIHSVLKQTYADFELLIVDDGSTDVTPTVVQEFRDPRLRYLPLGSNLGPSAARNAGIEAARGELLAFQDSDDEWLPEKLELQVRQLDDNPEAMLSFCGLVRVDTGKRAARLEPSRPPPQDPDAFLRALLQANFIWTQTWVVRATALRPDLRFDRRIRRVQDWDLVLRIAREFKVAYLPDVLVVAYATAGSLLSDHEQRGLDLQVMLSTQAPLLGKYRDLQAMYCRRLATWGATYRGAAESRRWARAALALEPRDPRNLATWLLALLGPKPYAAGQQLARALSLVGNP